MDKAGESPGRSVLVAALTVFEAAAWVLLLPSILFGGLIFFAALKEASGAPQEAAAGAIFATIFIGMYILARCVEKIAELARRR